MTDPIAKDHRHAVLAFAALVAILVLTNAYFVDRNGDIDELGLFNPSYMVAHYGKITYPIYGYLDKPVIVHPPLHVGVVGLFARLGFTWYYSEATPVVLLFLLIIAIVVSGPFPWPVQIGMLFAVGFVVCTGELLAIWFGVRPEGAVHGAWFAGLLLLEAGRLDNWNPKRLGAGSMMVTYAAGVHYYAIPAVFGLAVYAAWMWRALGWKGARKGLVALTAGSALVAIPYAALYLAPNFKLISDVIRGHQGGGSIAGSIRAHIEIYRVWAQDSRMPLMLRGPFSWGVPFLVFSTAGFAFFRSTRGIALAALPWELIILLFAFHKQEPYLSHEVFLFVAAVCTGLLMAVDLLARRSRLPRLERALPGFAVALLALYLVTGSPALHSAVIRMEPHVQEADLARAASRQILGPHASVVGRLGAWYSSGADHWHDVMYDILSEPASYDPAHYFSLFDTAVDYPHRSADALNGEHTISSWYAEGLLKLRGFYIGETNPQLRQLFLGMKRPAQLVGYATTKGQTYRFEEYPDGDYEVQSFVCPTSATSINSYSLPPFHVYLGLPKGAGHLVTTMSSRHSTERAELMRLCKPMEAVRGSLLLADGIRMVDGLRREDTPMQFHWELEDVPGFSLPLPEALVPPKDCVRLDRVFDLGRIQAAVGDTRVQGKSPVHIVGDPRPGSHAALIPVVNGAPVNMPCWIQLRLNVTAGRVGFLAWGHSHMLKNTPATLPKTGVPVEVVLAMPSLHDCEYIIIDNQKNNYRSRVDVLDVTVLVKKEDWLRNQKALASVK